MHVNKNNLEVYLFIILYKNVEALQATFYLKGLAPAASVLRMQLHDRSFYHPNRRPSSFKPAMDAS